MLLKSLICGLAFLILRFRVHGLLQPDRVLAGPNFVVANRTFIGVVPTVIRGVLKLRYLLLGGALGGGYSISKVRFKKTEPLN